jgi:hypothetical protein
VFIFVIIITFFNTHKHTHFCFRESRTYISPPAHPSALTPLTLLTSALCPRSSSATSLWPSCAAKWRGVFSDCGSSSSTHRQTGQAPCVCVRARECAWKSEGARGGVSVGRLNTHTHTYLSYIYLSSFFWRQIGAGKGVSMCTHTHTHTQVILSVCVCVCVFVYACM